MPDEAWSAQVKKFSVRCRLKLACASVMRRARMSVRVAPGCIPCRRCCAHSRRAASGSRVLRLASAIGVEWGSVRNQAYRFCVAFELAGHGRGAPVANPHL